MGYHILEPDMTPGSENPNKGTPEEARLTYDPVAGYFRFHRRRRATSPDAYGGDGLKDVESDKPAMRRGVVARLVKKGCEGDKHYSWDDCDPYAQALQPAPYRHN